MTDSGESLYKVTMDVELSYVTYVRAPAGMSRHDPRDAEILGELAARNWDGLAPHMEGSLLERIDLAWVEEVKNS